TTTAPSSDGTAPAAALSPFPMPRSPSTCGRLSMGRARTEKPRGEAGGEAGKAKEEGQHSTTTKQTRRRFSEQRGVKNEWSEVRRGLLASKASRQAPLRGHEGRVAGLP